MALSESGTCSLPGCKRPKYVDPANNRTHDFCGRTHANQAQQLGGLHELASVILHRVRWLHCIAAYSTASFPGCAAWERGCMLHSDGPVHAPLVIELAVVSANNLAARCCLDAQQVSPSHKLVQFTQAQPHSEAYISTACACSSPPSLLPHTAWMGPEKRVPPPPPPPPPPNKCQMWHWGTQEVQAYYYLNWFWLHNFRCSVMLCTPMNFVICDLVQIVVLTLVLSLVVMVMGAFPGTLPSCKPAECLLFSRNTSGLCQHCPGWFTGIPTSQWEIPAHMGTKEGILPNFELRVCCQ